MIVNAVFKDQTWLTHLAPTVVPDHEDDADKGEEKHKAEHPEENVEADCHETWDMCPQIIYHDMVGISISLYFNLSLKSIIVADRFPHSLCSCCQWLSLLGKLVDYKQTAGDGDIPNRAIHRWPKDDMFLSVIFFKTHPFVPVRRYCKIAKVTSNCVFIPSFFLFLLSLLHIFYIEC